jgi:hypothetical protein
MSEQVMSFGQRLLVVGLTCMASYFQCASAQSGETSINYSFMTYNPAKSLAGSRNLNGGERQWVLRLGNISL